MSACSCTHLPSTRARSDEAVDVVQGFLRNVRSGRALHLAPQYLGDVVLAHRGPPGANAAALGRSPQQYADHVAEMMRDRGPWDFDVLRVSPLAGGVVVDWQQVSSHGRRPVEYGRATYRVERGLITEYWIQAERGARRRRQVPADRRLVVTRHVDAPSDVVWRLLCDMSSWEQWGPWSAAREASTIGPSFRLSHLGRGSTLEQVVASVPEQRLSFETLAGWPVSGARTDVTLLPDMTGTTVRWHVSFDDGLRGAVLQPLLTRFACRVLQSLAGEAEHVARLDRAFERTSAAGGRARAPRPGR